MATLTQITLDADGTIAAVIEHDAGTGAPFFSHCNDAPNGVSTDWVGNDQSETTGEAWFRLSDVDADFDSMDTLNIDVDVRADGFSNDTCTLTARIYDANNDTTNPLTNETGNLGTQADSTRTQRNVAFAGLAGTKTQWNSAYIRFTWTYTKQAGPDNGQLKLFGCDIDGTYTPAAATFTGTMAASTPSVTASGSGTFKTLHTGTSAATIAAVTASGTGQYTSSSVGTSAITVGVATAAASGTHTAPVYTGSSAITVGVATAAGSGTFATARTIGNFTKLYPTGPGRRYIPIGSSAITVGVATAAASGTFTAAAVYTGSASISTGVVTSSASGTHTAPVYTGTSSITVGVATAAGSGTFTVPVYTGTAAIAVGAATAAASGTHTAPVYTGSSAITIGTVTAAGSGSFATVTFTGSSAATVPTVTAAAAGSFSVPVYDGSSAIVTPAVTAAASGTHTAPVYTGTSAITIGAATAAGSGTFTTVAFTGTSAATIGGATATASGTHTAPVYTGTAAIAVGVATAAASGTHTAPVYTGTAAATIGSVTATASGTFTAAAYTGSASITITATAAASGTFVAPTYTGSAAVAIGSVLSTSSGSFYSTLFNGSAAGTVSTPTISALGWFQPPQPVLAPLPPTLSITHPRLPRSIKAAQVYYADQWPQSASLAGWLAEWTYAPYLYANWITWATAPGMSTAELSWTYGRGILPGQSAFQDIAPLEQWNRRYVMIVPGGTVLDDIPSAGDEEAIRAALGLLPEEDHNAALRQALGIGPGDNVHLALAAAKVPQRWFGTIEIDNHQVDGHSDGVPRGEQRLLCYGPELFLDRTPITESYFQDSQAVLRTAGRGLTFNSDEGDADHGQRKTIKQFGEDFYRFGSGTSWSSRDIVEYLINSTKPGDKNGNVKYRFTVSASDLNKIETKDKPVLEPHNQYLRNLLNVLLSRQRLLNYWVDINLVEGSPEFGTAQIHIETSSEINRLLPTGHTIPAASNQYAVDYTESAQTVSVETHDSSQVVDIVTCVGARRRNIKSSRLDGTGDFDQGWTTADQGDYEDGMEAIPDWPAATEINERRDRAAEWRGRDEFEHVFAQWKLRHPVTVDGYANSPQIQLLKKMPIYRGSDYTAAPIDHASAETPKTTDEFRPIFAMAYVPGKWRYLHVDRLGVGLFEWEDEEEKREFSVRLHVNSEQQELWLRVYGAPQHAIAYGSMNYQDYDEAIYGQWDFRDWWVTYAFEDDRHCVGSWPPPPYLFAADYRRELVIEMGDGYRLDWIEPTTVMGIDLTAYDDETDNLEFSAGGFVRDDRPTLESYANLAYSWYSRTRSSIRLDTAHDCPAWFIRRGGFITEVAGGAGGTINVNATVTQVSLHYPEARILGDAAAAELPPPHLSFETNYGELDLLAL